MIDVIARARRQERAYAKAKPVINALMKLATIATFSERPPCTRSGKMCVSATDEEKIVNLTRICLNTRRDFSSANVIEEGDVLVENSCEITFTNALGIDFTSVHPYVHINEGAHKDSKT